MNRRKFIQLMSLAPFCNVKSVWSKEDLKNKYLVLIELKGGNDGLNTVVPYANDIYYESRPTIRIEEGQVLKLDSEMGLNPTLQSMHNLYQSEDLAIIQNVGYPKPNKSHFTSIDIWEKGSKDKNANGWLYDQFRHSSNNHLIDAIVFSGSSGLFEGEKSNFLKINNIQSFIKQAKYLNTSMGQPSNQAQNHLLTSKKLIKKVIDNLDDNLVSIDYELSLNNGKLEKQLKQAASLIKSNIDIPVLKTSIGGFDTHANQYDKHQELLTELDVSIKGFTSFLKLNNLWKDTLILTYSEFGRRLIENGNNGTDHGEASCMFCLGGAVNGGIYGSSPDLINVHNNNLIYKTDFREVYDTISSKWLNVNKKLLNNQSMNFI